MTLIDSHPFGCAIGGYLLVNAIAAGMPTPGPSASISYRWVHGSLNALALNVGELARARYAQLPQLSPRTDGQNDAGDPGEGNTPSHD